MDMGRVIRVIIEICPECGGVCHEMEPCGRYKRE